MTINGTLAPAPPPGTSCEFQWFLDGAATAVTTTVPSVTLAIDSPGAHSVSVAVQCGSCYRAAPPVDFDVPACVECPRITGVTGTPDGCAGGEEGRTATVTYVATTDPPDAPGEFMWVFDDGSAPETTTTPTQTKTYDAPGSKSVAVVYDPDQEGCEPSTAVGSAAIPTCGAEDEGGGLTLCMVTRWLVVLLLAGGTFFALAWACKDPTHSYSHPLFITSAIFFGLATIAALLWALFCDPAPCEWLLLAWEVALAGTFIAVYLAGCCTWLWWVALGFAVATIFAYAYWEVECDKERCQRWMEFAATLLIISGTGLAWITKFIRCGWTDLAAAVAVTLASFFVGKSWDCLLTNPSGPDPATLDPTPGIPGPGTRFPRRRLVRRRKRCGCDHR